MVFKIATKRRQSGFRKSILLSLTAPLILIIITFCALPLYTPWIFNKGVNAKKEWFPNPYHFVSNHKNKIINENIISVSNVLFSKEPKDNISIPTEKIWIENGGLEKMNHELLLFNLAQKKNKPKVKGYFKSPSTNILKARVNIRGTRATHQMVWKPSLKVRLKKNKTYKGFRDQTLIAPEDVTGVRNWISAELGKTWNVLNNHERFVRLSINNKNFGLYNKVSPFNESLLIQSNRLPGPIFNFNIYNKQLFYIWKKNWFEPVAWKVTEKKYNKDHHLINGPITTSKEILFWEFNSDYQLLNSINNLNYFISQEQFAKYLAILSHGGEKHYLNNHNALFWINPSSGLMEPIINDQNGYGLSDHKVWIQNPIIKNEGAFVRAWFKNPLNQAMFIEKLKELVSTFGNEKNINQMIRNQWGKIRSVLQTETSLSYSCAPARCFFLINKLDEEIETLIKDIGLRLNWIRKELNGDQVLLIKKNKNEFDLLTLGYSGALVQRKDKNSFNMSNLKMPTYYNNNFIHFDGVKSAVLLPSQSILEPTLDGINLNDSYSFFTLNGNPDDYVFHHRLSGKEIKLSRPINGLDMEKMKSLAGVNYLNLVGKDISPIILGPGKIEIIKSKVFNPGQPVSINAGTEIYLGKNVQIIVQGPLTIKGTRENPVSIKPIDSEQPFAVLALLGEKTNGSEVNFLNIEGGSVGKHFNLNFSGMFSVHDCSDIKINNSVFGKNTIGDDAVHIINSTAIIKNSIFLNSKMDALDLDLVNGSLVNNQFINPGNDGLDLSMGKVVIKGNRFIGCKDKCISAGEGTEADIKNSYIQNCNVGIAIKDKSFVTLENSIIDGCNIGWNSYRKKWRWELGGKGKIFNTKFIASKLADIAGDKLSSVKFIGNPSPPLKFHGKIKVNLLRVDES